MKLISVRLISVGDFIFFIFSLPGEQQDIWFFCSSLNGAWKTSIFLDRSKMKELNMKEIAVVDWLLTSYWITDNLFKDK